LGRVGVFEDLAGRYSDAAKSKQMNQNFGPTTIKDALAESDAQIAATNTVAANNAKLFKEQNNLMILEQKFIGEHLPNIFAEAMTKVVTAFTEKLRELGTGLTDLEVKRAAQSAAQSRAAALSTTLPTGPARPGDSQSGPVGPGNPRQQRDADTLPPWSRTNPLPVIIQPPVPPIVIPDQTPPPPRRPSMNDPLFPPPIPARADGTSGEIGKLFEPKDIIAQLHRGERVLNRDENTDLTKLFGMVTGDRSKNKMLDVQTELLGMIGGNKLQKKMPDAQGQMLKAIDNITSGMKTKAKPDTNKGFDAAYADISSGMMNTGPAQQALIDSQGAILKQIDSFKTNAMPTTANTGALLGAMPSLEIDKEAAEQIGQSFKETMGDEFKSAVTNISKFAEQMQRGGDQGLQQQMVGLLEEMRRSMQATAKASERLAQVASN
jgi:hypothetical protein